MWPFSKNKYVPKTPEEKEEAKVFGANYQKYRRDLDELAIMKRDLKKDEALLGGTKNKHEIYSGLSDEEILATAFGFNMLTYFFQKYKDVPTPDFELLLFGKFYDFPQKKTKTILKKSHKLFDAFIKKSKI